MFKYAMKRILEVIPTTFGILLLSFALFNIVGGSPAEAILGKNATAESIAAFNAKYGYDKPLVFSRDSQFVRFVTSLAKGDFGYSVEMKEPVLQVLKRGVGPSLSLTVPMLVCGTILGLMLALLAAAFRGRLVDKAILFVSTILMSVNYVVWVLAGQFVLSFATVLYMSPALGCGPRDTLMVILGKKLPKLPIGAVKFGIEALVLVIGILLGAPFGVGTVLVMALQAGIFQFVCRLCRFEPRSLSHESILDTIRRVSSRY